MSRDEQSDHLNLSLDDEEGATLQQLQGHSITYRIAMGPQAGRKVLTVPNNRTPKALPVMNINPSVTDLFAFTFDDFTLDGYEADASILAHIAFGAYCGLIWV